MDDDNDGFDLGLDNCINSINIKDGVLFFELSAVLRPGRFLGNHYIAFTVPIRTFIVTMDRVKEGIRSARKAKQKGKKAQHNRDNHAPSGVSTGSSIPPAELKPTETEIGRPPTRAPSSPPPKSFFSRFVEGYLL
jgi:hypothetical protein